MSVMPAEEAALNFCFPALKKRGRLPPPKG